MRPTPREAAVPTNWPAPRIEASLPDIRKRIRVLVEVAVANASTISVEEMRSLLPPGRFPTDGVLRQFLMTDERLSCEVAELDGEITLPGREDLAIGRNSQRALARKRLAQADDFLRTLEGICPWIELAGISGSTAFGGAKPGDDVDFFLVTTRHRLWISLFLAMMAARLGRLRFPDSPLLCFNRIVERADCEQDFRERQEPLFAREALNLAILRGGELYGHLLGSAPWMKTLFPELYATRLRDAGKAIPTSRGKRLIGGRMLNGVAFLILGPYLWAMGLVRNDRLRQAQRDKECFRTVIRRDRYATESTIYDELREAYRKAFA